MAYSSKQHEKFTRYVILFVLKDKTESIFHLSAMQCTHAKPSESGPFYPVHSPHNVAWNL